MWSFKWVQNAFDQFRKGMEEPKLESLALLLEYNQLEQYQIKIHSEKELLH